MSELLRNRRFPDNVQQKLSQYGAHMQYRSGRHFLQIPGPTNSPDAVLQATARQTIDHRGPDFSELVRDMLPRLQQVFCTTAPVVVFASSGTGAWEAALVNTLSPGDSVLTFDIGHFSGLWRAMAGRLGLDVRSAEGSWGRGVDPDVVYGQLAADTEHRIRAVLVVHNETSTGATSRVREIREAIDAANHPALLLVDVISSLASIEYRHDDWGVDVTVAGSQKGLMLPPGIAFNAISTKALDASAGARLARSYWDWRPIIEANQSGMFPHTPATNLLFGLSEVLRRLETEGLEQVWERHRRHAEVTRAAVTAWGLEVLCADPREQSNTLTAVLLPDTHDADVVRKVILERFDMSLGGGLGQLQGRVFRIGHLGDLNDLTLAGTLAGVEMGLRLSGVPLAASGVVAAMELLEQHKLGVAA